MNGYAEPGLAAILALALAFSSCASVPEKGGTKGPQAEAGKETAYDTMIARSILSTGNNARIKAAIAKAREGKPVNIAYIGGSITEGYNASSIDANWASLATASFRKLFGQGTTVNAGMSGTPSTLGMIRYRRDVVDRIRGNPDILFVEFAVNDGDDPTNGAAYESLVLNALKAENAPAVVLVFSVFQSQWNLQNRLKPVGEYYGLPMISIRDAIVPAINAGELRANEFFSDAYHPADFGHRLMADCITRYFMAVDAEPADAADIVIPTEARIGNQFVGIRMVDSAHAPAGVTVSKGGFTGTDCELGTLKWAPSTLTFPANWHKGASDANEPFTLTLTCKNIAIVSKRSASADFGFAEVYVDGELVTSLWGSRDGAWNNPWTDVVLDAPMAARHTLTVRMEDDSKDKQFTILAIGYTE